MYLPAHFEEQHIPTLHALMEAYPLGTWIVQHEQQLLINHIPFMINSQHGPHGTLLGHVARANPVWQMISVHQSTAVVFQGEQSYISPSWYASKQQHQRAVPTWNYAVVHAHGIARAIEDRDQLLHLVSQLTITHETRLPHPWHVTDAPADYIDKMLGSIVGIEISIDKLLGKWKLSQNRTPADKAGVIAGLQSLDSAMSQSMGERMQRQDNNG